MRTTRITTALLVIVAVSCFSPFAADQTVAKADELGVKASAILQKHCSRCHGQEAQANLNVADHKGLLKKVVVAGQAEASRLFQRITASDSSVMPPDAEPLSADEINVIKQWIAAGASEFTAPKINTGTLGMGEEQILAFILQDVSRLAVEDRKHARYFSLMHRKNAGASAEDLEVERDALAKAINHLSWQPKVVKLIPVPSAGTIFRIDLRTLGWDKQPYRQVKAGKLGANSSLNIFDLALLEYPYGRVSHNSRNYAKLVELFLSHAKQVRPIVYVRADWFVSTVTQPPLYEDFLQLPRKIEDLEKLLEVDSKTNIADFKVIRAGNGKSGVSAHNRVIERHASKYGWYWKSYDFASSVGTANIFSDPINFTAAGGEMIFALPNGLQGYYLADAAGNRLNEAPREIVLDKHAADQTVRNGLACMRCHQEGMIGYEDKIRPTFQGVEGAAKAGMNVNAVLKLYPEQKEIDRVIKEDGDKFMAAMQELLGKPQGKVESLTVVSKRFLDGRLGLSEAASEMGFPDSAQLRKAIQDGLGFDDGLAPLLNNGSVPRDAWESSYERLLRGKQVAVPLIPADGLTRLNYVPRKQPKFTVELKTNKAGNLFRADEEIVITVKPSKDVFIELIGTTSSGKKVILAASTTKVKAGTEFRFPAEGKPALKVKKGVGKEQVTVFASEAAFTEGQLLRGDGVADRVVYPVQVGSRNQAVQMQLGLNWFQAEKKTITIETR